MKVVLVFAFACIALTSAERCVSEADCDSVSCTTGNQLKCERLECTCVSSSSSTSGGAQGCSKASDCTGNCGSLLGSISTWYGKWHCVDSKCYCPRPGGK